MTSTLAHVENPADRITFQMIPQASPGQCGICGKGQDPNGFVDPRLDFEFWGSLIFCRDCTLQMASIFGFITPEVYEDIVAEASMAKLELSESRETITKLENVIDGLTDNWRDSRSHIRLDESSSSKTVDESERQTSGTESVTISGTDGISKDGDGESEETPEPSSVKGPFNI